MTVVVALRHNDRITIGAERGVDDTALIMPLSKPKIWQYSGYLFGCAGELDFQHLAKFRPPPPKGNLDEFMATTFMTALDEFYTKWSINREYSEDTNGYNAIICVGDTIYEHTPDGMTMISYDADWLAVGSGASYALGSIFTSQSVASAKTRVRKAVEAACNFDPSCIGPVDVLSMKIKNYEE